MKSKIKKIRILLFMIGFIVAVIFLLKAAFELHPYIGWITAGFVCMLISNMLYD